MASLIINHDAVQGETFLPGQIFVFSGFALRANSLGHLELIESYAPGHQVKFGSLNYVADICGDLTFNGFEAAVTSHHRPDEHGLNLSSGHIQEIAPIAAPASNPEPFKSPKDGKLNPITVSQVWPYMHQLQIIVLGQ